MRMLSCIALSTVLLSLPALASPAGILSANRAAMGGRAWDGKAALALDSSYAGQGLTGTAGTIFDLRHNAFADSYAVGPQAGASGYDGAKAWEKEPSGTVTEQAGGDVIPLAITEAYLDRNLWWRADRGGASIVDLGRKADGAKSFDALSVTPPNGAMVEAWFDRTTHLLARTIEVQGSQTITTFFSDYRSVDGVKIAYRQIVDDGSGAANRQTMTLTRARFMDTVDPSVFARPAEKLDDYFIAGGATETTVPFRLINNHIYADVSINGSAPMPFIFDTGGHTLLTPATAKALKIGFAGSQTMSGGGDSVATGGVTRIASIGVGAATLKNQPASVVTFSSPEVEGTDVAGMLGYELFDRFVTRIDYGRKTLTFIDKKTFDPKDSGTRVDIRFYHQFPEVLGSFDGVPGRFGIDTGSRMTLLLTGPFARDHDILANAGTTKSVDAMTGWGIGGPSFAHVFRGHTLTLGGVTIAGPLTAISIDKGGAGAAAAFPNNVGGGILKRFVVTLDYDHSGMYLKPVDGSVPDLDSFDRSGLWINSADQGFKVIDVTKGGPAEQAGLAKGDIIVSIDGKPATDLKLYDVREMLRNSAPGTAVKLRFKRGDAVNEAYVLLREMI